MVGKQTPYFQVPPLKHIFFYERKENVKMAFEIMLATSIIVTKIILSNCNHNSLGMVCVYARTHTHTHTPHTLKIDNLSLDSTRRIHISLMEVNFARAEVGMRHSSAPQKGPTLVILNGAAPDSATDQGLFRRTSWRKNTARDIYFLNVPRTNLIITKRPAKL